MKLFLTIGLSLILLSVSGQIKVDGKATGRHAKAINRAKEAEQLARENKEQAERIKEQIEAREEYKKQYDSLMSVWQGQFPLDSIEFDSIGMDSLQLPECDMPDSVAIAEVILSQADMQQYRELLTELPEIKESDISQADSIALAKAQAILEEHAQSFLPAELNQGSNPLEELLDNPLEGGAPDLSGGVPELSKPSRPNPNLIRPEQAQELFKKIDPEQFQGIQEDIKGLKEKYSSLPDSRFPEEGKKRSSLEDQPFKKRLHLGGNFNIQSTDPLIISSNIQLGYWINKKWMAGVGLILREQFNKQDSLSFLTGDSHGFSIFSRYDISKGFFAWAEMDRQIDHSIFNTEELNTTNIERAYLLGIGREFKIGPVRMNSMILYDLSYKNNNLHNRPLVLKVGFQFSKKPE